MLNYLLNEEDFHSLKKYIDFLSDLPPALKVVEGFTESVRRQGHKMITPPNAQMLAQAAMANACAWRAIKIAMPMMGVGTREVLRDTHIFIDEFRAITKGVEDRRSKLISLDIKRFSLSSSPRWGSSPPRDVIDLMRALFDGLRQCERSILEFRAAVTSIGNTLHSIFVRFIESLMLGLCSCDGPIPKIEAYYTLGKFGLPGMRYDPQQPYSETERLAKAREHIAHLRNMRIRASCAVDNLTDFCYRLQYLLADARRELQTNHPAQTLVRSNVTLILVSESLVEVKYMSESLTKISSGLR
ncbi:hypothetical protein ACYZUD_28000 [Pseudomonas sp. XS1P51]